MTTWTQLHTSVHVSGGDRFSFQLIRAPEFDWSLVHSDIQSQADKDFIAQCLPNRKPKLINGVERPMTPHTALRMYLCESMSTTFALGQTQHNNVSYFMVGSRSQKDLFKIQLKFPETTTIKVWDANTQFYIRVSEGDSFSEDGSASIGDRRTHSISEGW